MNTYTFTQSDLEQLLISVITSFAGEEGVYDFSRTEDNIRQVVVERAIAALDAEPHCSCGRKLEVVGWNKEDYGDTSIDMPIMACPICNATPIPLPPNERDEDWTNEDWENRFTPWWAIPFDGSTPESADDTAPGAIGCGDNISPAAIGLQPPF